ncbi:uncharacterized protein BO80DRAFT_39212 [Aspergillus ibericus CBS 121593]|uniref:Uncharacterized protein n=1 Tax=Aspergillus ibericus CBS 121593 TaxID=1448316 RepID=A0A395H2H4_9EURO|nr:hypothetical protein BO80DRAFT_39212 [Aspergillus ibericus CBS 121593]RAL02092.1 hypothetical protein BO80DRAFT_39212 [Aspergillus ibericus CBS 121593]
MRTMWQPPQSQPVALLVHLLRYWPTYSKVPTHRCLLCFAECHQLYVSSKLNQSSGVHARAGPIIWYFQYIPGEEGSAVRPLPACRLRGAWEGSGPKGGKAPESRVGGVLTKSGQHRNGPVRQRFVRFPMGMRARRCQQQPCAVNQTYRRLSAAQATSSCIRGFGGVPVAPRGRRFRETVDSSRGVHLIKQGQQQLHSWI